MVKSRHVLTAAAALTALVAGTAIAGPGKGSVKIPKNAPSNTANSSEIRLSGSAGTEATGAMKAVYRERARNGTVRQVFKVAAEDWAPGTELAVTVNGAPFATLITNEFGAGEFQFSSLDNDPGGELPLPSGFPRLRAGDTVTVGNLSATLN